MNPNDALLWLLALPLVSSPVIYLVGRICVRRSSEDNRCRAVLPARWLSLAALLLPWIPLIVVAKSVLAEGRLAGFVGGIPVNIDGISLLLTGTVLLLGTLVVDFLHALYGRGRRGREILCPAAG